MCRFFWQNDLNYNNNQNFTTFLLVVETKIVFKSSDTAVKTTKNSKTNKSKMSEIYMEVLCFWIISSCLGHLAVLASYTSGVTSGPEKFALEFVPVQVELILAWTAALSYCLQNKNLSEK